MKLLLATLVSFSCLLSSGAELPKCNHQFVVIAHRGNHTHAHENTLTAIENAVKSGADYVELDVRRTADGEYVLMHDRTVDRMTDGRGAVADLTRAQLRNLKIRDLKRSEIPADYIPTFKEALAAIKTRINLYLDFKAGDRAAVASIIREAGVVKQVLVYDDVDAVEEWRRVAPELPLIISPPADVMIREQLKKFVTSFKIEVLDGAWKSYSQELVVAATNAGAKVWPDIQNRQEDVNYFASVAAVGFTGVQTDHPNELISWLIGQHRR